jgi:hypothetical protein
LLIDLPPNVGIKHQSINQPNVVRDRFRIY